MTNTPVRNLSHALLGLVADVQDTAAQRKLLLAAYTRLDNARYDAQTEKTLDLRLCKLLKELAEACLVAELQL